MSLASVCKHHVDNGTLFFRRLWLSVTGRKQAYHEIEDAIKLLVDSLNAVSSVYTIASCQGHWDGYPPYVYFKAPVHVAALIEKRLWKDATSNHPKLDANWCIHGLFDGDEQTFLLHAPNYHRGAESLVRAVWLFGARRRRLNVELVTLAYLVEQAMLADIGQDDKPEIDGTAR